MLAVMVSGSHKDDVSVKVTFRAAPDIAPVEADGAIQETHCERPGRLSSLP